MNDPTSDVERKTLSDRLDVVEELLGSTTDEQDLVQSINDMGISAKGLAAALRSVEKSQRELVMLKKTTADLGENKAESTDVEAMRQQHRRDITRMRGWVFSAAILAAALLGATIFAFTMYNKAKSEANSDYQRSVLSICNQREKQSATMREFLDIQAQAIKDAKNATPEQIVQAKQQIELLRKAFPAIDCGQLKR